MNCGNGSERAQHPLELFGNDWLEFGNEEAGITNNMEQKAALLPTGKK
jgi:hypothetical protein